MGLSGMSIPPHTIAALSPSGFHCPASAETPHLQSFLDQQGGGMLKTSALTATELTNSPNQDFGV